MSNCILFNSTKRRNGHKDWHHFCVHNLKLKVELHTKTVTCSFRHCTTKLNNLKYTFLPNVEQYYLGEILHFRIKPSFFSVLGAVWKFVRLCIKTFRVKSCQVPVVCERPRDDWSVTFLSSTLESVASLWTLELNLWVAFPLHGLCRSIKRNCWGEEEHQSVSIRQRFAAVVDWRRGEERRGRALRCRRWCTWQTVPDCAARQEVWHWAQEVDAVALCKLFCPTALIHSLLVKWRWFFIFKD